MNSLFALFISLILYSPSNPFVNTPFEVQLFLLDGDKLKCGEEIPISINIMIENDTLEGQSGPLYERLYTAPEGLYQYEPKNIIIGKFCL